MTIGKIYYLCTVMNERKPKRQWLPTLLILLGGVLLFVLNLVVGSVGIPLSEFWDVIMGGGDETYRTIILEYRLPQAITALLAGIGLSISGLLMQTLFRNPLADPSILGISSGASLGVAIVVLLTGKLSGMAVSAMPGWSTVGVTIAAFAGAFLDLQHFQKNGEDWVRFKVEVKDSNTGKPVAMAFERRVARNVKVRGAGGGGAAPGGQDAHVHRQSRLQRGVLP